MESGAVLRTNINIAAARVAVTDLSQFCAVSRQIVRVMTRNSTENISTRTEHASSRGFVRALALPERVSVGEAIAACSNHCTLWTAHYRLLYISGVGNAV